VSLEAPKERSGGLLYKMVVKNKLYIITLIIFLLLAVGFYQQKVNQIISYEIEGQTFELLTADNKDEWEIGLMNIRELEDADGMIFIFPGKKQRVFWNKNTFVDLDVYWIADDKVVDKDYLPSIEKSTEILYVSSPEPVNKVVEIIRK
jgi:uncharacterized membrane protein (UPF0127 family)